MARGPVPWRASVVVTPSGPSFLVRTWETRERATLFRADRVGTRAKSLEIESWTSL